MFYRNGNKTCYLKYWEIIADRLSKASWTLGWVSGVDHEGRTIWVADAHRNDGRRFIVHADENLTAFFVKLESAVRLDCYKDTKWVLFDLNEFPRFAQQKKEAS